MAYQYDTPDYIRSPYTGMVRKHWVEAALFLLEGAFSHLSSITESLVFPHAQNNQLYPKAGDPEWRFGAERFEGIARTFLIAAPLIRENPNLEIHGFNLRDYYAVQILRGTELDSVHGFRTLAEIVKETGSERPFQQTCECASLVICLFFTKEQIWDQYSPAQRDQIARYLSDFGHALTNVHNWRWFNVLILTFLKLNGYTINEQIYHDHLQNILSYYAGDGWYRDGDLFDYYSPWAFQCYGPFWCFWYGYRYEPELAAAIEANFNALMTNYDLFFDRDGHSIMWGRSNIYRSCASTPFASGSFLKNVSLNPGLARRILSGNLLQFITKEEMFVDNIPSHGYYGTFQPMVQSYSSAASPFWMGKPFLLALYFTEESPLWAATESNGIWDQLGTSVHEFTIKGPGIKITNYGQNGTSEIKTSKYLMDPKSNYMPDYSRLAFNSDFPWEAWNGNGPEAMNYTLKYDGVPEGYLFPNLCLFGGEENGVLYRRIYFNFQYILRDSLIDLAEIEIDFGVIRVDRPRISRKPYQLFLGHYGVPHLGGKIALSQRMIEGRKAYLAATESLQTALIPYQGWDEGGQVTRSGVNAVTTESTLLYVSSQKKRIYEGVELLITIMLHRKHGEWTDAELAPIVQSKSTPFGIELGLRDGRNVVVNFRNAEGRFGI